MTAPINYEYETLLGHFPEDIFFRCGNVYMQVVAKKNEACLLGKKSKDSVSVLPPVTSMKAKERVVWFTNLAKGRALSSLIQKPPTFKKKEHMFEYFFDFQITPVRAVWYLKLAANMSANTHKKNKIFNGEIFTVEYAHVISRLIRNCFYELFEVETLEDKQELNDRWHYFTRLSRTAFDEGVVDRQEFINELCDIFSDIFIRRTTEKEDTAYQIVLWFEYFHYFLPSATQNLVLARRVAVMAAQKITMMKDDFEEEYPEVIKEMLGDHPPPVFHTGFTPPTSVKSSIAETESTSSTSSSSSSNDSDTPVRTPPFLNEVFTPDSDMKSPEDFHPSPMKISPQKDSSSDEEGEISDDDERMDVSPVRSPIRRVIKEEVESEEEEDEEDRMEVYQREEEKEEEKEEKEEEKREERVEEEKKKEEPMMMIEIKKEIKEEVDEEMEEKKEEEKVEEKEGEKEGEKEEEKAAETEEDAEAEEERKKEEELEQKKKKKKEEGGESSESDDTDTEDEDEYIEGMEKRRAERRKKEKEDPYDPEYYDKFVLAEMFKMEEFKDALNCLVTLLYTCIVEQPGAMVYNKFFTSLERKPHMLTQLGGSPLDYLPCNLMDLPFYHGHNAKESIRELVEAHEHDIVIRSELAQNNWVNTFHHQKVHARLVDGCVDVIGYLDSYDILISSVHEIICQKIFLLVDNKRYQREVVTRIRLCLTWAITVQRDGEWRGWLVAKILRHLLDESSDEPYGYFGGTHLNVILLDFINHDLPKSGDPNFYKEFANFALLFHELAQFDVFTHATLYSMWTTSQKITKKRLQMEKMEPVMLRFHPVDDENDAEQRNVRSPESPEEESPVQGSPTPPPSLSPALPIEDPTEFVVKMEVDEEKEGEKEKENEKEGSEEGEIKKSPIQVKEEPMDEGYEEMEKKKEEEKKEEEEKEKAEEEEEKEDEKEEEEDEDAEETEIEVEDEEEEEEEKKEEVEEKEVDKRISFISLPVEEVDGYRLLDEMLTPIEQLVIQMPISGDELELMSSRTHILYGSASVRAGYQGAARRCTAEFLKIMRRKMYTRWCRKTDDVKFTRRSTSAQMKELILKFRLHTLFDRHLINTWVADGFVNTMQFFIDGDCNQLPTYEAFDIVCNLFEETKNTMGFFKFVEIVIPRLPEFDTVIGSFESVIQPGLVVGQYAYVICSHLVKHMHYFVRYENAIDIINGLYSVMEQYLKAVDYPRNGFARTACAAIFHLREQLIRTDAASREDLDGDFEEFSDIFKQGSAAVTGTKNYNKFFFADVFAYNGLRIYMYSDFKKRLPSFKDPVNRYSFVVNAFVAASSMQRDFDRISELASFCSHWTAHYPDMANEWMGAIRAVCSAKGAHNVGFSHLMEQIDVSDCSIHYALSTFAVLLASKYCYAIPKMICELIDGVFPAVMKKEPRSRGGYPNKADHESEPHVCVALLYLAQMSCCNDDPFIISSHYRGKSPVKKLLVETADLNILNMMHWFEMDRVFFPMIANIGIMHDFLQARVRDHDIKYDPEEEQEEEIPMKREYRREWLPVILRQVLVSICEQDWIKDRMYKIAETGKMEAFNQERLKQNCLGQQLLRLGTRRRCERAILAELSVCNGNSKKALIDKLLSVLNIWNIRATLYDLKLMIKEISPESSNKHAQQGAIAAEALMGEIGKCCRELFAQAYRQKKVIMKKDQRFCFSSLTNHLLIPTLINLCPTPSNMPSSFSASFKSKFLNELSNMFDVGNEPSQDRLRMGGWLIQDRSFMNIVRACMRGERREDQEAKDNFMSSILKQLQDLSKIREDPCYHVRTQYSEERKGIYHRIQLIAYIFDEVCKQSTAEGWALMLFQLMLHGVITPLRNLSMYNMVFDMLSSIVMWSLTDENTSTVIASGEKNNGAEVKYRFPMYMSIVKKLRKELHDTKTTPETKNLHAFLPLPKCYQQMMSFEPFGTLPPNSLRTLKHHQIANIGLRRGRPSMQLKKHVERIRVTAFEMLPAYNPDGTTRKFPGLNFFHTGRIDVTRLHPYRIHLRHMGHQHRSTGWLTNPLSVDSDKDFFLTPLNVVNVGTPPWVKRLNDEIKEQKAARHLKKTGKPLPTEKTEKKEEEKEKPKEGEEEKKEEDKEKEKDKDASSPASAENKKSPEGEGEKKVKKEDEVVVIDAPKSNPPSNGSTTSTATSTTPVPPAPASTPTSVPTTAAAATGAAATAPAAGVAAAAAPAATVPKTESELAKVMQQAAAQVASSMAQPLVSTSATTTMMSTAPTAAAAPANPLLLQQQQQQLQMQQMQQQQAAGGMLAPGQQPPAPGVPAAAPVKATRRRSTAKDGEKKERKRPQKRTAAAMLPNATPPKGQMGQMMPGQYMPGQQMGQHPDWNQQQMQHSMQHGQQPGQMQHMQQPQQGVQSGIPQLQQQLPAGHQMQPSQQGQAATGQQPHQQQPNPQMQQMQQGASGQQQMQQHGQQSHAQQPGQLMQQPQQQQHHAQAHHMQQMQQGQPGQPQMQQPVLQQPQQPQQPSESYSSSSGAQTLSQLMGHDQPRPQPAAPAPAPPAATHTSMIAQQHPQLAALISQPIKLPPLPAQALPGPHQQQLQQLQQQQQQQMQHMQQREAQQHQHQPAGQMGHAESVESNTKTKLHDLISKRAENKAAHSQGHGSDHISPQKNQGATRMDPRAMQGMAGGSMGQPGQQQPGMQRSGMSGSNLQSHEMSQQQQHGMQQMQQRPMQPTGAPQSHKQTTELLANHVKANQQQRAAAAQPQQQGSAQQQIQQTSMHPQQAQQQQQHQMQQQQRQQQYQQQHQQQSQMQHMQQQPGMQHQQQPGMQHQQQPGMQPTTAQHQQQQLGMQQASAQHHQQKQGMQPTGAQHNLQQAGMQHATAQHHPQQAGMQQTGAQHHAQQPGMQHQQQPGMQHQQQSGMQHQQQPGMQQATAQHHQQHPGMQQQQRSQAAKMQQSQQGMQHPQQPGAHHQQQQPSMQHQQQPGMQHQQQAGVQHQQQPGMQHQQQPGVQHQQQPGVQHQQQSGMQHQQQPGMQLQQQSGVQHQQQSGMQHQQQPGVQHQQQAGFQQQQPGVQQQRPQLSMPQQPGMQQQQAQKLQQPSMQQPGVAQQQHPAQQQHMQQAGMQQQPVMQQQKAAMSLQQQQQQHPAMQQAGMQQQPGTSMQHSQQQQQQAAMQQLTPQQQQQLAQQRQQQQARRSEQQRAQADQSMGQMQQDYQAQSGQQSMMRMNPAQAQQRPQQQQQQQYAPNTAYSQAAAAATAKSQQPQQQQHHQQQQQMQHMQQQQHQMMQQSYDSAYDPPPAKIPAMGSGTAPYPNRPGAPAHNQSTNLPQSAQQGQTMGQQAYQQQPQQQYISPNKVTGQSQAQMQQQPSQQMQHQQQHQQQQQQRAMQQAQMGQHPQQQQQSQQQRMQQQQPQQGQQMQQQQRPQQPQGMMPSAQQQQPHMSSQSAAQQQQQQPQMQRMQQQPHQAYSQQHAMMGQPQPEMSRNVQQQPTQQQQQQQYQRQQQYSQYPNQ